MASAATTITLTPERYAQLDRFAQRERFASPQEAADQLLGHMLSDEYTMSYSPQVLEHLDRGFNEAKRGEFAEPQEVSEFFRSWRDEIGQ